MVKLALLALLSTCAPTPNTTMLSPTPSATANSPEPRAAIPRLSSRAERSGVEGRTVTIRAPHATLALEVANTEAERERGLMDRTSLRPHTGMLFVFDGDDVVQFWMKDTLIPLDMVFIAANGRVRTVFANVPVVPVATPDDKIPRRTARAKYVIELPAGEAVRDGIVRGIRLRLPHPIAR